jgi:hypothetical protein
LLCSIAIDLLGRGCAFEGIPKRGFSVMRSAIPFDDVPPLNAIQERDFDHNMIKADVKSHHFDFISLRDCICYFTPTSTSRKSRLNDAIEWVVRQHQNSSTQAQHLLEPIEHNGFSANLVVWLIMKDKLELAKELYLKPEWPHHSLQINDRNFNSIIQRVGYEERSHAVNFVLELIQLKVSLIIDPEDRESLEVRSHPKYSLFHSNATNPNERQRETKITVGQIGINLSDPLPPSKCGLNEFIPNKVT